jgi:hypothetical protein
LGECLWCCSRSRARCTSRVRQNWKDTSLRRHPQVHEPIPPVGEPGWRSRASRVFPTLQKYFDSSGTSRWIPSIAVNKVGNLDH